jgi:hypothetical protein
MESLFTSPPSGIDPEVWNELPHEIQQEIMNQTRGIITQPEKPNKSTGYFNQRKNSDKLKQLSINFLQSSCEVEFWKDPSFPPSPCSVDGRKENGQDKATAVASSQPKCKCRKVMVSRQVSKVGVNQGRYFYSCPMKHCNSFIWAEGVPHRSAVMNLEWKHFHSTDGWKMVTSAGYLAGH